MPTQSGPRVSIAATSRCPNGSMIDIVSTLSLSTSGRDAVEISGYERRAIARFSSDTNGGPE